MKQSLRERAHAQQMSMYGTGKGKKFPRKSTKAQNEQIMCRVRQTTWREGWDWLTWKLRVEAVYPLCEAQVGTECWKSLRLAASLVETKSVGLPRINRTVSQSTSGNLLLGCSGKGGVISQAFIRE
jgi:hypothetical protein